MEFLGKTITLTSKKTGKKMTREFAIASSFPNSFEYQQFLITLYMEDYTFYQTYSNLILMFLNVPGNNLSEIEIVENATILSTINAMFIVRDRLDFENEQIEHIEMQNFIKGLSTKQK